MMFMTSNGGLLQKGLPTALSIGCSELVGRTRRGDEMDSKGKKTWFDPSTAAVLREVPIEALIVAMGGEILPRSSWERRSFYSLGGTPITVDPDANTYLHTEAGQPRGRGAISFLRHFAGMSYADACRYLQNGPRHEGADLLFSPSGERHLVTHRRTSEVPKPPVPRPYERGWPRVMEYLRGRGLSPELIAAVHEQGLVYADGDRAPRIVNAVFRCSAHCAFVRGIVDPAPPGKPFRRTFGSGDDLAPWVYGSERAPYSCIVESPISGLSLVELSRQGLSPIYTRRGVRIVAIGGRGLAPEAASVRAAIRGHVVAASDADAAGDQIAARIMAVYPGATRWRPTVGNGSDWNDQLCMLRDARDG